MIDEDITSSDTCTPSTQVSWEYSLTKCIGAGKIGTLVPLLKSERVENRDNYMINCVINPIKERIHMYLDLTAAALIHIQIQTSSRFSLFEK